MNEENKKGILVYHKWYVSEAEAYKMSLSTSEMGELFFAVMETLKTGELVEVSEKIKVAYTLALQKVAAAKTAYKNTCDKRAEAGSKGGKAKAENKKEKKKINPDTPEEAPSEDGDESLSSSFKPPTKTDFRKMAKHLFGEIKEQYDEDDELRYDEYEIDQLFLRLQSDKWKYHDIPIKDQDFLESICFAQIAYDINAHLRDICIEYGRYSHDHTISVDSLEWFIAVCVFLKGGGIKIHEDVYPSLKEYIEKENKELYPECYTDEASEGTSGAADGAF